MSRGCPADTRCYDLSMSRRSWSQRIVLAAAALALVLKAAVPMAAAGAAELRNIPVSDVCPMYGVAMAAMVMPMVQPQALSPLAEAKGGDATGARSQPDGSATAAEGQPSHAGPQGSVPHGPGSHDERSADSCALSGLATMGAQQGDATPAPALRHATVELAPQRSDSVFDASALWSARRKQGPPAA
jgi:hypothetical protein